MYEAATENNAPLKRHEVALGKFPFVCPWLYCMTWPIVSRTWNGCHSFGSTAARRRAIHHVSENEAVLGVGHSGYAASLHPPCCREAVDILEPATWQLLEELNNPNVKCREIEVNVVWPDRSRWRERPNCR